MGYYQEILKYAFQEPPTADTGITFIKAESVVRGVTGAHTISGIASGDLILGFGSDSAGSPPDIPSNATQIYSVDLLHNSCAFRVFSTGTSFTFNDVQDDKLYTFLVFRNVNSTTPLDTSVTTPSTSGNVNTITPPPVTTVTDEAMIVLFLTIEDESGLVGNVTFDSGYTKATEVYDSNPDSYNLLVYKKQSTAGTESPGAFSWSPTDNAHAVTIALRPE